MLFADTELVLLYELPINSTTKHNIKELSCIFIRNKKSSEPNWEKFAPL